MQFAFVLDRAPARILGGNQDFSGCLHLGKIRPHELQQSVVSDSGGCSTCADSQIPGARAEHHYGSNSHILEFGSDVVRWHDAAGQCSSADFTFGAVSYQRMIELPGAFSWRCPEWRRGGRRQNPSGRNPGFHAGQRGNLPNLAQGTMGFDQHMNRNPAVDAIFAFNITQCFELNAHISCAAGFGEV